MNRIALLLVLLGGTALGHGGVFRPPPGRGPGDPTQPGGGTGITTPSGTKAGAFSGWESWWFMNREPYLRLRERIRERLVITGRAETERKRDPFDRLGLRDGVLLPVMLEALRDEEEAVRATAAVALGKFEARDAEPALFQLLKRDKSRQVREAAMLGLMLMRDPSLRDALRGIARDREEERRIRGFAVLGLGFLEDAPFLLDAVAAGKKGLRGTRPTVEELRACAALALGFTGSSAAVPLLSSVAVDRHAPKGVRGYAGSALGRIGNPLALSEMLSLVNDRKAENLARYGAAIAVGHLVGSEEKGIVDLLAKKAQRDKRMPLRSLLVMSLGRIGGERAAAQLVGGMRSCERELRGFHYLALGITGSEDVGPILLDALGDLKNSKDRAACALGLALCGHKAAAPALRDLLEDGHPAFVPHGMVALGILDDSRAIPIVKRLVEEERDPMVRREGAIALALLRGTAAVPDLVDLLKTCSTRLSRGAVAWALGFVGTDRAVEPLLEIYRDDRRSAEERAVALAALGRIGDLADIPLLADFAVDINPYVASQAVAEALTIL